MYKEISTNIIYEHPMNERIRSLLRIEHFYNIIENSLQEDSEQNCRLILEALLNISDLLIRSDIKNEIINYSNKHKIDLIIYGNSLGLESSKDLITKELNSLNIPLEIMNTDAACRTWTVLLSEGRCVCAFIKPQR